MVISTIKFQTSTLDDAEFLSTRLRLDDKLEIQATGKTPIQALSEGIIFSEYCYTAFYHGRPIGMFGVSSHNLPEKWGSIWFLGSDETSKFPISFVRYGKKYVRQFLDDYLILINAVYSKNTKHIEWLKAIGFKLAAPMIINGHKFIQFYKTKES